MALYQKLSSLGIRWIPQYDLKMQIKKIELDCSEYLDEIKKIGKRDILSLEKILTKVKLPEIKKHLKPKTLIYTYYVQDIVKLLKNEIKKEGWSVACYTGEDKTGKDLFIKGDVDILIGSSSIGTGVDGLQEVCNTLIINILPWTSAEFEQLKGRIYRQGQKRSKVEIVIPITYAEVGGERRSWCEYKWNRIQFKKSVADACVDGVVPEGHLRTPTQAFADLKAWLKRLDDGKINEIKRTKVQIPLEIKEIKKREQKYGDLPQMNFLWNSMKSDTLHLRLKKDPSEWEQYHALYKEARKSWLVVPYEEIIKWCKRRPKLVIGDFGCGEAKISEALSNKVYSFDHIAINENVIACDMTNTNLKDKTLDVAIFSLSLMGRNITDYIKESHRCLKLDGHLFLAITTSKITDLNNFIENLEKLGFDILKIEKKYKFTFIRALKSEKKPKDAILKF